MGGLLQRLAMGTGKAIEMIGMNALETKREERLEKMRGAREGKSQEFQKSERIAGQEFKAGESEKTRVAKGKTKDKVKKTFDDEENPGNFTTIYEGGRAEYYDKSTDTTTTLGKGKPGVSDIDLDDDTKWGKKVADREAGTFTGDVSDFPHFKSEERAASAAAQFRSNARRDGTLDAFDTEFAKKGWKYIQELAGDGSQTSATEAPTSSTKSTKGSDAIEKILADNPDEAYDTLMEQILSDKRLPKYLRDEAKRRLEGLK